MGFVVHSIWTCDYLRERCMLRDDDVPLPKEKCDPINIRDSYFGGRTNAIVLHREFPPNSCGGYLDFCSLYLHVLKYERYPMGHPTCFTNNFSPFFKVCCKGDVTLPSPGHCHVSRIALENTLFWSDEGKKFTSQKDTISHPTHQNQWKVDVSSVSYMCRE